LLKLLKLTTTTTVSSQSYTTATVTHCDDNGCKTKTVTSEAPEATTTTTISPKSYTTVTVTHCDDNGCKTKTITSEASKQTSLATSTVTKSAAPTSHTAASSTFHWYCRSIRRYGCWFENQCFKYFGRYFHPCFFLKLSA
ncbi:YAR068W-like protein, partial [Saccharomyces cerevisiae FostersB]